MKYLPFAAFVIASSSASANIDLDLRPDAQTAPLGSTVSLDLYAVSDTNQNQSIGAMDVILTWDPGKLQYLGFTNVNSPYSWFSSGLLLPGGLNASTTDGDAMWTAFAQPGNPAYATPSGLLVTTFRFQALALTPSTSVAIPRNYGGYQTVVYDGFTPNMDVTGQTDSGVSIEIIDNIFYPSAFNMVRGSVWSGSLGDTTASDDVYLTLRPGPVPTTAQAPIQIEYTTQIPMTNVNEVKFDVEAGVNATGIQQKIELYNYTTSQYVQFAQAVIGTADNLYTVTVSGANAVNYVDPNASPAHNVLAKVSYRATTPTAVYPWLVRHDLVRWRIKTQ